ncbi:MAG: uroporphyrinogen-III synthase [Bacteroidota bacterium]
MQEHSLFITRKLSPDSPILALQKDGWQIWHESLLEFIASKEPAPDFSANWIFFSSPKAVQFFPWSTWDGDAKVACLGPGTARWVQHYRGQPADWTGNGQPEEVAKAFSQAAHEETVLFPRARQSRRSIQRLMSEQIKQSDWVVYHNQMKSSIQIPRTDLLVFTSPLNAVNYYRHYPDRKEIPSIAIGATTAQWLRSQNLVTVIETIKPSEVSLRNSILNWQKTHSHE